MKKTLITSVIGLTSFANFAVAGAVAYVAPAEPVMIEEVAPMGSSGAWIIPLIAIGLILLIVSQDESDTPAAEEAVAEEAAVADDV